MDYAYFTPTGPSQTFSEPYMNLNQFPAHLGQEGSNGSSPDQMDHSNFLPYDASFTNFEPSSMLPPHSGSPRQSQYVGSVDSGVGLDIDIDSSTALNSGQPLMRRDTNGGGMNRGSSEEKDLPNLTPAQSRRKAQNRAAQRAFRERKERHVRDLEAKLTALESQSHSLQSDNERLKLALQRAETENEILRATSATNPLSGSHPSSPNGDDANGNSDKNGEHRSKAIENMLESGEARMGPSVWKPRKIDIPVTLPDKGTSNILANDSSMSTPLVNPLLGQRPYPPLGTAKPNSTLLPAAATWDLILAHPLFKQGLIDIGDVCERLRSLAKCDGQGLAFDEADVIRVIEGARRGGGDELI
ncbi:MAG: hypothetical protein M1820_003756 [Bogoriella megaspora]|nr:MAG: hypothetical protein M1820_003756 [Bogoriella megaspora]